MKKILLSLVALVPFFSFAQVIDELPRDENGKLYYSDVIKVDSLKMDQLYICSKQFFSSAFKSIKNVIQVDDKAKALVIGKVYTDMPALSYTGQNMPVKMWYTIKIQSKDGRFKYEIYDIYFKHHLGPTNPFTITETAEEIFSKKRYFDSDGVSDWRAMNYKTMLEVNMLSIISLIKTSMSKSGLPDYNKDSW